MDGLPATALAMAAQQAKKEPGSKGVTPEEGPWCVWGVEGGRRGVREVGRQRRGHGLCEGGGGNNHARICVFVLISHPYYLDFHTFVCPSRPLLRLFTLDFPSYYPVMTHCKNRALREDMYRCGYGDVLVWIYTEVYNCGPAVGVCVPMCLFLHAHWPLCPRDSRPRLTCLGVTYGTQDCHRTPLTNLPLS